MDLDLMWRAGAIALLERARFVHRADYNGDSGEFAKAAKPILGDLIELLALLNNQVTTMDVEIKNAKIEAEQLRQLAKSHERTAEKRGRELQDARERLQTIHNTLDRELKTILDTIAGLCQIGTK